MANYTIPNEASAFAPRQASPDKVDFDVITAPDVGNGVLSGCAVSAQGSPNMTVAVASGEIVVASKRQAVTGANVTITAADGTNARVDLIVCNNSGTLSATAGTAAAVPLMPAIPANSVVLAAVYVPASATSILSTYITDKRVAFIPSVIYCTSATRPTSPLAGWRIYETDTGNDLIYTTATTLWRPPWNTAWGWLASVKMGGVAYTNAETTVATSGAITVPANRRIKLSFGLNSFTSTDAGNVTIRVKNGSTDLLDTSSWNIAFPGTGNADRWAFAGFAMDTPASGSNTWNLTVTKNVVNSRNVYGYFIVEDVGPNGAPV